MQETGWGEIKQNNRKHFVKKKRKAANCEYEFMWPD